MRAEEEELWENTTEARNDVVPVRGSKACVYPAEWQMANQNYYFHLKFTDTCSQNTRLATHHKLKNCPPSTSLNRPSFSIAYLTYETL